MSAPVGYRRMLDCLDREIRLRRGVYPGLVAKGRLRQAEADYEIASMCAIRDLVADLRLDGREGEASTGQLSPAGGTPALILKEPAAPAGGTPALILKEPAAPAGGTPALILKEPAAPAGADNRRAGR
jgi:hypothetical protein